MKENTGSAFIVQRRSISTGDAKSYLLSLAVFHGLAAVALSTGASLLCKVFLSFGLNPYAVRIVAAIALPAIFAALYSECCKISALECYVEDGVLVCGDLWVDLWNLTKVRVGHHYVQLNDTILANIAKPREFLDSLEVVYFEITGEYLP